jgi:hypothetical protein
LPLWAALVAANPYLEEGKELYGSMRYDKAAARLRLAAEVPTNSVEERRQAHDLLARSQAALGQLEQAEATYANLLEKDPSAPAPDDASPKIRAAFQKAKERLYSAGFVALEPAAAAPGVVDVRLVDPWSRVGSLVLFESMAGSFTRRELELSAGHGRARLSEPEPGQTTRYYVEALSPAGEVLARAGSPESPLAFIRPEAPSLPSAALPTATVQERPRRTNWPAWAVGAASVVAAGVGTALALSAAGDSKAAEVAPWASETRALDDAAYQKAVAANVLIGAAILGAGTTAVLVWSFE